MVQCREFRRLSDREWRSYTHALMWSVANRTDGVIEHRDIEDIPGFDPSCVPPFVDAGLWSRIDDGWLIVDYLSTQSSRAQLERDDLNRERNRERQRRHRAKPETTDSGNVTRDITRDHAGQDRTGQDREYCRPRKKRKQRKRKRGHQRRRRTVHPDRRTVAPHQGQRRPGLRVMSRYTTGGMAAYVQKACHCRPHWDVPVLPPLAETGQARP